MAMEMQMMDGTRRWMRMWALMMLAACLACSSSASLPTAGPAAVDAVLARYDVDHDGALDAKELAAYVGGIQHALLPAVEGKQQAKRTENAEKVEGTVKMREAEPTVARHVRGGASKNAPERPFWSGFVSGIVTIWATEIGDKTFFIAAVLSMKNDRVVVFAGALGALIIMTVLSVVMGVVATRFLPPQVTHYIGAVLFVFFGVKMLVEARKMDAAGPSDELAEVENELLGKKTETHAMSLEDGAKAEDSAAHAESMMKLLAETFVMTFLAEWGDRSQIATVTLSATKDMFGVTLGAVLGHSMCTGLAVAGGKLLATRISERTVALAGGALFLVFAVHSLVTGPPAA